LIGAIAARVRSFPLSRHALSQPRFPAKPRFEGGFAAKKRFAGPFCPAFRPSSPVRQTQAAFAPNLLAARPELCEDKRRAKYARRFFHASRTFKGKP